MNTYLLSISKAILIFPIIAFIITLPFMIINYNKYGSISKLRTLIIYSFVLYLLCAFFLVIFPMPSQEYVNILTIPKYQLIPFNFINDINLLKPVTFLLIANDSLSILSLDGRIFINSPHNKYPNIPPNVLNNISSTSNIL